MVEAHIGSHVVRPERRSQDPFFGAVGEAPHVLVSFRQVAADSSSSCRCHLNSRARNARFHEKGVGVLESYSGTGHGCRTAVGGPVAGALCLSHYNCCAAWLYGTFIFIIFSSAHMHTGTNRVKICSVHRKSGWHTYYCCRTRIFLFASSAA